MADKEPVLIETGSWTQTPNMKKKADTRSVTTIKLTRQKIKT